jgi:tryptophan halogenase
MQNVELDERGFVSALQLEQTGRFPVQFVIDCTGFRGSILQQALGEPFLDYGKHLLVDRAIPMPVPHVDPEQIKPCTTATALSGGWMFNVPLQSRMGTGYIYSSAFKSDEQAREKMLLQAATRLPKLIKQLSSHRDYLNSLRQPLTQSNVSFSMNYQS